MNTEHIRAWDGRGVTVGILDSGVDLGHPSLNTTSTGAAKIQDWVTYTHPATDGDPTWRFFTGALTTITDGTTTQFGRLYTGIPNGAYRIARMREDLLGATSEYGIACGSDLDRDGTCGDFFIMLWQPGSDATTADDVLLIDSDNDASLADESPMQDFSIDRDIGSFGHDNPATQIRESVPFVVQPEAAPIQGLYLGEHRHRLRRTRLARRGHHRRQQPLRKPDPDERCRTEARSSSRFAFVSSPRAARRTPSFEGMIWVIEQANVDLVNMSIGGLPALNVDDTRNTRTQIYNRLIEDNNAQIFISAGNSGVGREHDRRPGPRHEGDGRRLVHPQGDVAEELRLGLRVRGQHASVLVAWPDRRRFPSSHRSSRPARRSRPCRPGRSVSRSRASTRFRPVTGCSTARRWLLLRPPVPRHS